MVKFYGFCDEPGKECLVLEYFDGGSVASLLKKITRGEVKPLGRKESWHILKQAAAGLDFLHRKEVIHRNTKQIFQ